MKDNSNGRNGDSLLDVPGTSILPEPRGDDESLPLNWSRTQKWLTVITLSALAFIVNLSTVICAPASIQISQQFDSHSNFLGVFYITVWNLGEAIAPLYIGPLSERVGRLRVYHFYNVFFIIFTAITGFSNSIGMIIAFRFLTGAATTAFLNNSVVGDIFAFEARGSAMSVMSLMPLVGTAIGPIIGGYLTQRLSWRWTFWLTAILTGIVELAMVLVFRETYLPYIQRQREKKSGAAAPEEAKARRPLYMLPLEVLRFLLQPFVILFRSRPATIIALYLSIIYAYLFLLAATLATVFQQNYSFSETNSGLIYLAQTTGMFIGTLFCRFTLDRLVTGKANLLENNPRSESTAAVAVRSERRLMPALPGMLILPTALFMYGWTLQTKVHWMAPAVATALAGFCLSTATIPVMNYLVDVFGDKSASAIAAVLPLRYVLGTFLPVAAPYMYGRLGYGWANSLLALVLICCLPVPLLLIIPPGKNPILVKLARLVGNHPA
ncbi:major facilitator superfamily domain-containing protein [Aspergillus pseudonomiae]|uniref:Major facilitator superfamily domain-containing protein n=1 Tax=Aspergillus pseudonomiae TaxID=1506151 RepID=A0A5N6HMY5_9EURO|nr:major facilitator superfamily domain-containing protein [Aspergillus pseudonomiae]KAB8255069.1 major facilitator superfamily domain-containing protein [Aspergillus pseudonomiae]KAE8405423.1 major facilitator superfamily domain-containing protein [Aspergillus pseudonomiae]